MEEIRVQVCKYPDRPNLVMRYVDPLTAKQKTKSAGTADEKEAERRAAVWQDELTSGRYQAASKVTWADFRKQYEAEKLSGLAPKTRQTARTALNHVERVLNPDRLAKLTPATLSRLQAELRKPYTVTREVIRKGKATTKKVTKPALADITIASVLRHLRPALAWAVSMSMLPKVPDMHPPKRPKGQTMMRGRPIAGEEFDRMIAAVPQVRPSDSATWTHYLTGLWLSGLRLEESLALSWDQDEPFTVDLSGRRPAFRIYAEAQKSRRDELLPMTPDFAEWLLQTPEAERHGRVFKVNGLQTGKPITPKRVCRLISKFGKKAGVVVNKADGKFASAHDLRRAFGTRWARRVTTPVLRQLMRHASIDTTMAYYVSIGADEVADELWAKFARVAGDNRPQGNISGNIWPESAQAIETPPAGEPTEAL